MDNLLSILIEQSLFGFFLFLSIYAIDQMVSKNYLNHWRSFLWTSFFIFLLLPIRFILFSLFPAEKVSTLTLVKVSQNSLQQPIEQVLPTVQWGWVEALVTVWSLGMAISLIFFVLLPILKEYGLKKKLEATQLAEEKYQGISVLLIKEEVLPFVSGFFKPRIYFPNSLQSKISGEQTRGVLAHEQAHIINHDLYKVLLARIVCSLFWFCPFVYMAHFKLREAQEYLADEHSLNHSELSLKEYATTLLDLSTLGEREAWQAFGVSILNPSHLKRRLKAMKYFNKNEKHSLLFPCLFAIAACLASVTAVSVAQEKENIRREVVDEGKEKTRFYKSKKLVTISAKIFKNNDVISTPMIATYLENEANIMVFDSKNKGGLVWLSVTPTEENGLVHLSGSLCVGDHDFDVSQLEEQEVDCDDKVSFQLGHHYEKTMTLPPSTHPELSIEFVVREGDPSNLTKQLNPTVNGIKGIPMDMDPNGLKYLQNIIRDK